MNQRFSFKVAIFLHVSVESSAVGNAVAAERTKVESVELVLPPHANHQVILLCISIVVVVL